MLRRNKYGLSKKGEKEAEAKSKRASARKDSKLSKSSRKADAERSKQKRTAASEQKKSQAEARKKAAAERKRIAGIRRAEREAERSRKQSEREIYQYYRGLDEQRRENALRLYSSWSLEELRSEAKDHGIADYRKDWKRMSRGQLAEWLSEHHDSARRTYYSD